MKNINSLSGKSLNSTLKDTSPLNQIQTIFLYLQNHTATASMASAETGIPQKYHAIQKRFRAIKSALGNRKKGLPENRIQSLVADN